MLTMPNESYMGAAPPKKQKKLLLYIMIGIFCLALVVLIVILIARANPDGGDETLSLAESRENTKTLQIYATLDDKMTAGELEKAAKAIDPNAEISFFDNGTGQLKLPDQEDYILFDHELGSFEGLESPIDESDYEVTDNYDIAEDDEFDDDDYAETETIEEDELALDYTPSEVSYQSSDIVREIRYVYPSIDNAYSISHSDDDSVYVVFNLMYDFTFPTKEEAIKAYLAPVVVQPENGD